MVGPHLVRFQHLLQGQASSNSTLLTVLLGGSFQETPVCQAVKVLLRSVLQLSAGVWTGLTLISNM